MAKSILVVGGLLILAFSAGWIMYKNSPMREIERSRDAVSESKSWHMHTMRYIPGQPPETVDIDTLCPSFQRRTSTWTDASGATQVRDSIHYFSSFYSRVEGQWLAAAPSARFTDPGILECRTSPIGGDDNSLPLSGVVEEGSAKRASLKEVNGESCRVYDLSLPTPHDPSEREFRFSICISERDHLPRETRRTPPGSTHEGVSVYSEWNAMNQPQLPAEISK